MNESSLFSLVGESAVYVNISDMFNRFLFGVACALGHRVKSVFIVLLQLLRTFMFLSHVLFQLFFNIVLNVILYP